MYHPPPHAQSPARFAPFHERGETFTSRFESGASGEPVFIGEYFFCSKYSSERSLPDLLAIRLPAGQCPTRRLAYGFHHRDRAFIAAAIMR